MNNSYIKQFCRGVIAPSESEQFSSALREWEYVETYLVEEGGTCICGHFILEHCAMRNILNRNPLIVGNCCVKKFTGISKSKHFDAIRRVQKDTTKPFNPACLDEALNNGIINEDEYRFYINTWRKRNLTDQEKEWRISINERILKAKEQKILQTRIGIVMGLFPDLGGGGVCCNKRCFKQIDIKLKRLGNVRIPVNGKKFYDWIRKPDRTPQEVFEMLRRKFDRLPS